MFAHPGFFLFYANCFACKRSIITNISFGTNIGIDIGTNIGIVVIIS